MGKKDKKQKKTIEEKTLEGLNELIRELDEVRDEAVVARLELLDEREGNLARLLEQERKRAVLIAQGVCPDAQVLLPRRELSADMLDTHLGNRRVASFADAPESIKDAFGNQPLSYITTMPVNSLVDFIGINELPALRDFLKELGFIGAAKRIDDGWFHELDLEGPPEA